MTTSVSRKNVVLSWRHKALLALAAFICVQAFVVVTATADRALPAAQTESTVVQSGTADRSPRSEAKNEEGSQAAPQDTSSRVQPEGNVSPFPDSRVRIQEAPGFTVIGEGLPAGLYKFVGMDKDAWRTNLGHVVVRYDGGSGEPVSDLSGDFEGSKYVYLNDGLGVQIGSSTYAVAEQNVPKTLYTEVHLNGMYLAGVDIEPGTYHLVRTKGQHGNWIVYDSVGYPCEIAASGSTSNADNGKDGIDIVVSEGQFLMIENCRATKIG